MKLTFKKAVLLVMLCWAGIKLYERHQAENVIDWSVIPNRTAEEINQEELLAFLPVWSDYVQHNIGDASLENDLPPQAEKWLLRRKWRPKRFFYVEQRLRVILKTLEQHQNSQQMISSLEQQLAALRARQTESGQYDPQAVSLASSIENLLREQQARLNIEKVSPQELSLVAPLQPGVREALELNPERHGNG